MLLRKVVQNEKLWLCTKFQEDLHTLIKPSFFRLNKVNCIYSQIKFTKRNNIVVHNVIINYLFKITAIIIINL